MAAKTNAVRLLEAQNISFELREYEVDENDLSAETVAAKIGYPPEQVFKTLLVRGDSGELYFAVLPGNAQLDLKAFAQAAGERKAETVGLKELEPLTGYIRGGVTAMGARKAYPVFLDEWAQLFEKISVSGGRRGLQVLLSPADYARATGAVIASFARFA
ncbi:MAG: Cys-tRNA(Pro) deacylase [Bryobacter sp.]